MVLVFLMMFAVFGLAALADGSQAPPYWRRLHSCAIAITITLSGWAAGGESFPQPYVQHGLVSLSEDKEVPAQEAGLLISLHVKEGDPVKQGMLMAQIDDRHARMQKHAAEIQLRAAQEKARDDVEVRYALAAYRVAQAEAAEKKQANRSVPGTVPESEIRRLELTVERARLQIDKSMLNFKVAKMNAEVHQAEVEASQESIRHRQILAPADGTVVTTYLQAGEWVNLGDPVLRVVRMDRLRIEGFLSARQYNANEVDGRPVTVHVQLARGRDVQFRGNVVFVSPLVQAGSKYRVRAEVENRMENGRWLLRPGMSASMRIHSQMSNKG